MFPRGLTKISLRRPVAVFALVGALCGATPAFAQASCNATNRFLLDWDAQTTQSIGTTTRNYTVTNGAGQSVTMTMSFGGDTADYNVANGLQSPSIQLFQTGGTGQKTLTLSTDFQNYQNNISSNTDVVSVTFSFSSQVRDVTFSIFDIDSSNGQWRDWIQVTGTGAAGYVPAIVTPAGNTNAGPPNQISPDVVYVGPNAALTPPIPASQVLGNGSAAATSPNGNITASFVEPVTSVTIRYANGPSAYTSGTTGNQWIGVHDITFCPMPDIDVTKSSTPFNTTGLERFNIPNTDVIYTLRVENNGGSTVDANEIDLFDILPDEVTYFNGDFDGAGPVLDFEWVPGTSGLNLTAAGVTYSSNGGSSYIYGPNGSYDAAVDAVQFQPTGTMAANSFFEIRFRARIN